MDHLFLAPIQTMAKKIETEQFKIGGKNLNMAKVLNHRPEVQIGQRRIYQSD
jgi:hypothetical protein